MRFNSSVSVSEFSKDGEKGICNSRLGSSARTLRCRRRVVRFSEKPPLRGHVHVSRFRDSVWFVALFSLSGDVLLVEYFHVSKLAGSA